MANYANQQRIIINFVEPLLHTKDQKDENGDTIQFCQPFNWEPMLNIMLVLNGNEYKVYMYLLKWAGKGIYDFSPADLETRLNISESTSQKIKKRFIELGFFERISQNKFNFIPVPKNLKIQAQILQGQIILKKKKL